jgi:hypothetical protein
MLPIAARVFFFMRPAGAAATLAELGVRVDP